MVKNSIMDRRNEALFSRLGVQGFSVWMWGLPALLGVFLTVCFAACCPGQEKPSEQNRVKIAFERDVESRPVIVVGPLKDPATGILQVWVEGANQQSVPALSGESKVEHDRLIFRPRFPFVTGMKYEVVFFEQANAKPFRATLEMPADERPVSRITAVYPSSNTLPENTLKFYIHFSEPMRKGNVYRYFRLREAGGKDVELPFLEIEQEFWSRDSKRLTLLLDPGRIKRGLKPREDMGPILAAGKNYELVIDGGWPDFNGRELGDDFVKRFRALPEDHVQPDPAKWKIWLPKAGSRDPLIIRFTESLDHSMLFKSIDVQDGGAKSIDGTVTVSDHEKRWSFEPLQSWPEGTFNILVNPDLEDNVGNSVGRQFDVDVFEKTEPTDSSPLIQWKIEIAK
jgi:hypothetical protein